MKWRQLTAAGDGQPATLAMLADVFDAYSGDRVASLRRVRVEKIPVRAPDSSCAYHQRKDDSVTVTQQPAAGLIGVGCEGRTVEESSTASMK